MNKQKPTIAIILAAFHGQAHIYEQLQSILNQDYPHWTLYISDDSKDNHTMDIVKAFQNEYGADKIVIFRGPQRGANANFLFLLNHPEIIADYYAFADQDDVWLPNKLSRALQEIKSIPRELPAMYCARTEVVDENLNHIGYSPKFKRRPSFNNAIVQNIGGGNTQLFNHATRECITKNLPAELNDIVAYDWWVYMVVCGVHGYVYYDAEPCLKYRQHANNSIGSNLGWWARIKRLKWLMGGRFKNWNDRNLRALQAIEHLMPSENQNIMHKFIAIRAIQNPFKRTINIIIAPIYRQTLLGNMGLILGAFLGKV